jgi:hypothetical protein
MMRAVATPLLDEVKALGRPVPYPKESR